MDRLQWTQAARKHRVGRERARYVLANPITSVPASTPEGKPIVIYLGDDQEGRPLEVGVMEREPDEADLVLHVMDLRAKYRPYYEAGKEEEEP